MSSLKLFLFILIVCSFDYLRFTSSSENDFHLAKDNLKAVIVLYRHGDRTPIKTYENDPYKNLTYWPCDWGQLTNLGKKQQYELGQWLRQSYGSFLPKKYSNLDIVVHSTDVDRTLMSAESNLAGLYPPSENETWLTGMKWQPIPIHTQPQKEDEVIAGQKHCPKYDQLYASLMKTEYFESLLKNISPVFEYMSLHAGQKIDNIQMITHLFSTFYIEELYNMTLPNWTKQVYPDKIKGISEIEFATYCYTKSLQRLKVGRLIYEWIQHFENVLQAKTTQKFFMYSGHDTTIANILMALNSFEPPHLPPYCATIILELYGDETIKIWYKNSTEPFLIDHNICSTPCSLRDFKKSMNRISIDSKTWYAECNSAYASTSLDTFITIFVFVVVVVVVSLILVLSGILTKFKSKKSKNIAKDNGIALS